ncbi:MAG: glycosyl hydrolase family 18 protein [Desulfitobacteriia bacterium]
MTIIILSLHFWDGYGNRNNYERYLGYVPEPFTDYIQILVPNFCGPLQRDGSFGYCFRDWSIPTYLVSLGQSKKALVMPLVLGSGQIADHMLYDPFKRRNFIKSALKILRETNSDGFLVDLEGLTNDTGPGLNALMKELSTLIRAEGKLVAMAVMPRTSEQAEPWSKQYDYARLASYVDYLQIMAYDFHYATSPPGPIAPLDWVAKVAAYAGTKIPSTKILLGIPYYGRIWNSSGRTWKSKACSLSGAREIAARHSVPVRRERSGTDPVGVPTFTYFDNSGREQIAYFDDPLSLRAKLNLVSKYNLRGVGCWSMAWVDRESAKEIYPLLKTLG